MRHQSLHMSAMRIGALMLGTVLLLTGCDQGSTPPEENTGVQVSVAENDSLDEYLVDPNGVSLYLFTDQNGNPVSCTGQCAEAWPPLLTEGEPVASGGADESLLSTTERPDGMTQVVYNGWPLFYFVNDQASGDVNGQGIESFGGKWFLVSPVGDKVTATGGNGDDDGDDNPGY